MIKDEILFKLRDRLTRIERNHGYFSQLSEKRFVNEKMLQLEVLKIISELNTVQDYLPEKCYPENSREKVDVWFLTTDKIEHWLEIKMRGTNYHKKQRHGKAITNGIDSIIHDIERLQKLPSDFKRYVLFSFLPLFPDRQKFLNHHLSRLSKVVGRRIEEYVNIPLKEGFFALYLEEI